MTDILRFPSQKIILKLPALPCQRELKGFYCRQCVIMRKNKKPGDCETGNKPGAGKIPEKPPIKSGKFVFCNRLIKKIKGDK